MDSKFDQHSPLRFSVTPEEAGDRLDTFLATRIDNWSRARLQRVIEDGDVLINGRTSKPAYKIRAHDEIEIELTSLPAGTFAPENISIDIVYEDDEVVVVNKPAGMVVHPAAGNLSGTLANALAFHFAQLSTAAGPARPGIVHRLDKGTSGLLVIAKTEPAHEDLANQFRARTVFKSYVALVHGQVERSPGQIDQPIARDPRNRTRMAIVRGGRPALSLYRIREPLERFTCLDVELKTGRTHQIRVHLAWMKHPVVGDEVYGGGRDKTVSEPQVRAAIAHLKRQFLHAHQLGFQHPRTKKDLNFTAPMPPDLERLLELIREKQPRASAS